MGTQLVGRVKCTGSGHIFSFKRAGERITRAAIAVAEPGWMLPCKLIVKRAVKYWWRSARNSQAGCFSLVGIVFWQGLKMKGEYIDFYIYPLLLNWDSSAIPPPSLWVARPCFSVASLSFPLPSGGRTELIRLLAVLWGEERISFPFPSLLSQCFLRTHLCSGNKLGLRFFLLDDDGEDHLTRFTAISFFTV